MREKRKHRYNDQKLQGYLISALIAIELLLVILLLVYLYNEFNRVIDSRFYKIHSDNSASWPEFLSLLAATVGAFLLVNALLLFLAHLVWDRYVAQTVELFSNGLERMIRLDFSSDAETRPGQHRIIELLANWRAKERQRNHEIALLVDRLSTLGGEISDTGTQAEWRQVLKEYRGLLPTRESAAERSKNRS